MFILEFLLTVFYFVLILVLVALVLALAIPFAVLYLVFWILFRSWRPKKTAKFSEAKQIKAEVIESIKVNLEDD